MPVIVLSAMAFRHLNHPKLAVNSVDLTQGVIFEVSHRARPSVAVAENVNWRF